MTHVKRAFLQYVHPIKNLKGPVDVQFLFIATARSIFDCFQSQLLCWLNKQDAV